MIPLEASQRRSLKFILGVSQLFLRSLARPHASAQGQKNSKFL